MTNSYCTMLMKLKRLYCLTIMNIWRWDCTKSY